MPPFTLFGLCLICSMSTVYSSTEIIWNLSHQTQLRSTHHSEGSRPTGLITCTYDSNLAIPRFQRLRMMIPGIQRLRSSMRYTARQARRFGASQTPAAWSTVVPLQSDTSGRAPKRNSLRRLRSQIRNSPKHMWIPAWFYVNIWMLEWIWMILNVK